MFFGKSMKLILKIHQLTTKVFLITLHRLENVELKARNNLSSNAKSLSKISMNLNEHFHSV